MHAAQETALPGHQQGRRTIDQSWAFMLEVEVAKTTKKERLEDVCKRWGVSKSEPARLRERLWTGLG